MKLTFKALLLLFIPCSLFAQNASVVKRQANIVGQALIKSDYNTVIDHTYPKAVALAGGKQKMLQMMTAGINQMKTQGFAFEKITIGTPGNFYKAGTELHCIVPEEIIMKTAKGRMQAKSNLLCISADGGKNWSFLDLNRNSSVNLKKLFPNFNNNLVIPQPQPPTML